MGYVLEIHQNNEVYTVEVGQLNVVISADSGSSAQQVPYVGATNDLNLGSHNLLSSDVLIEELKSDGNGGIIPNNDYSAFKTFFAGLVDKSVKSFIRGLVSWVNSLVVRVGLLEDKYILKYVVPTNVASVILTQDKYGNTFNFVEGDEIEISFHIKPFPGAVTSRILMRVNNIATLNYNWANGYGFSSVYTAGSLYYGQSTVLRIKILNGELNGYMMTMPFTAENALATTQAYGISSQGLNLTSINSIYFWSVNTAIPAETVFLVKKM